MSWSALISLVAKRRRPHTPPLVASDALHVCAYHRESNSYSYPSLRGLAGYSTVRIGYTMGRDEQRCGLVLPKASRDIIGVFRWGGRSFWVYPCSDWETARAKCVSDGCNPARDTGWIEDIPDGFFEIDGHVIRISFPTADPVYSDKPPRHIPLSP